MSSLGRVLGTIALMIAALLGLLMSACGGFFTIAGLGQSEMIGALVISIPSLIAGVLLAWFAGRRLRGRLQEDAGPPRR